MKNNTYFEINCIKNTNEFMKFKDNIELIRREMFFFNFTKTNNEEFEFDELMFFSCVKILLYCLVILIGLIGNFLILIVICFSNLLKSTTNLFILNLAICDLAILFSCSWVHILLTVNKFWILGESFCKINSFTQMVSIISSVLTLSIISCDRYIGIVHPLKSKRLKRQFYYLIIVIIWLVSVLISLPTFIFRTYTERKWSDFTERYCDDSGWPIELELDDSGCVKQTIRPYKRIYYTNVIVFFFFFPFAVMLLAYSLVIKKLWNNEGIDLVPSTHREASIRKQKRVLKKLKHF